MDRAVATLDAAVGGGHMALARRSLGEVSNEAEREAVLDVLARHATRSSALAVELLIEAIDRWGVARSAVRRVLLDEAAVDDVTQDTLITVAQTVGSFRDAKFTTWLQQLARTRAVDHLRRVRSTDPLGVPGQTEAARLSAMVNAQPAVRQLLDDLPERYRDAVLLRDVERLPYTEVAVRLGRSVDTIRSHVARGRALLAGLVARSGDGG